jgi:saccharopine dehydrogenase (NAD+, L-lysine-forming)
LTNYQDLIGQLSKIEFPPINIVLTGGGRVAQGAFQLLKDAGIRKVDKETFLNTENQAQFVHLTSSDLYVRKDGKPFSREHFHQNHGQYAIHFEPYYEKTDLMINGVYWTKNMPAFFSKEETSKYNFRISVIADISCDVDGSIPITYKATTIANPVIGWDPNNLKPCEPYQDKCISIMAVGNLPCELPKDASELFGSDLVTKVFPEIMKKQSIILKNATILQNGELTEKYQYLQSYAHSDLINK